MRPQVDYVLAGLIGYVLGSVPVALLVAKRHGVDLHRVGDGNPGAWNALDHLGARRAWPAFIGDGLKGLLAGVAGWLFTGEVWGAYTGVAAAMLGHALPLFDRFRGGKSVMTFAGGAFAVAPLAALIALAACGAASAARDFATGARVGVFGFPLVQLGLDGPERVAATGGLMCLIGALFVLRRRSAPATSARAAG
jgi:acyl phosphate:glycerol-3-phosphate acyltransferase